MLIDWPLSPCAPAVLQTLGMNLNTFGSILYVMPAGLKNCQVVAGQAMTVGVRVAWVPDGSLCLFWGTAHLTYNTTYHTMHSMHFTWLLLPAATGLPSTPSAQSHDEVTHWPVNAPDPARVCCLTATYRTATRQTAGAAPGVGSAGPGMWGSSTQVWWRMRSAITLGWGMLRW
jgi:hypothetical protein